MGPEDATDTFRCHPKSNESLFRTSLSPHLSDSVQHFGVFTGSLNASEIESMHDCGMAAQWQRRYFALALTLDADLSNRHACAALALASLNELNPLWAIHVGTGAIALVGVAILIYVIRLFWRSLCVWCLGLLAYSSVPLRVPFFASADCSLEQTL